MSKPTWTHAGLAEALKYAAEREIEGEWTSNTLNWSHVPGLKEVVGDYPDDFSIVRFTDGTALLIITDHSGPYSEVTPDLDIYTAIRIIRNWNLEKGLKHAR